MEDLISALFPSIDTLPAPGIGGPAAQDVFDEVRDGLVVPGVAFSMAVIDIIDIPSGEGIIPALRQLDVLDNVPNSSKKIPTINGRTPINSKFAGQTHPSGVRFNDQGFPDFTSHSKAQVQIDGLTGNPRIDNRLANQAAGFGNSSKAPKGFVWHHAEDGRTMQLVPVEVHNATRHTGGAAVIRNGGFD